MSDPDKDLKNIRRAIEARRLQEAQAERSRRADQIIGPAAFALSKEALADLRARIMDAILNGWIR